ncbi:cobaltochelatase subunit CobN [Ottowia testudinis]|uniref:Cobaltochelatase subunit CobN n=1 Tax=Ottowia testudinis TaxID=2816950 RepID=A0A975CJX7_9BURK|nr:cobaltochelatase subunit CobN [Ottowia testudinis]QTD46372.1 cobaltochelatase subunit CobN [Ottowia testudinis]
MITPRIVLRLLVLVAWGVLFCLGWVGTTRASDAAPTGAAVASREAPAPQRRLLFIASGNVPKGKFRQLAQIAAPHGMAVEVRYLSSIPAKSGPSLWDGYDAVFFDSYLYDQIQEQLAQALPGLKAPHAWLYDAKPRWGGGLPDGPAKALVQYYSNGGQRNFEGFFTLLAATLAGQGAPADLAPPVLFPKVAVYHPKAPQLVFDSVPAFLQWRGVGSAGAARPPIVAIAMHQQYIASMQTGFIDDLVARIEAAGAMALPVYGPMMPAGAIAQMLRPDSQAPPLADVMINTQIMLNAEGRREEFAQLGLPVLQATPYRRGDEAAWAADAHGVALMDVPFYLAQPEYAGVIDIQIAAATRKADDEIVAIGPQAQAVVNKALALVALQRKPAPEKQIALMFWNYPAGEKNFSAAFLNVPRSLISTADALRGAGYDVPPLPPEAQLIAQVQRLLAPSYRDGLLPQLADDGLAALLPVSQYRRWLGTLPEATRGALLARWGEPERSSSVITRGGTAYFAIPRLQLGKLALLPLPGRADKGADGNASKEKALYHSMKPDALPPHAYLAAYLWVREGARPDGGGATPARDALIHFGTHGTQEWLPGKERGLSVFDPGMLAVGDLPVVYPYIVDNVGEATQAKRRGRAVIVSHQTAPLQPAGLHQRLTELHDLLHQWLAQDEGAVKEQIKADILARARADRIAADMGWPPERAAAEFPPFIDALHDHLHELAETVQPVGLHTLGQSTAPEQRAATVLMMLGRPFWQAAARHAGVAESELDEALVADHQRLAATPAYQLLDCYIHDSCARLTGGRKVPISFTTPLPADLRKLLEQGRTWWRDLDAAGETRALLAALAGRHIPTSYGGDAVKNPDSLPTGRNLYGFDPSRIPTRQAWAAGQQAAEQLIAAHRQQTGKTPTKLAVSLWSVETMRHLGLLEAQALWLLGVEPTWDDGGRVTGVRLVPRAELGRPRVDVVLSATGLYRDHFPNAMKHLARAAQLAAQASAEGDNPVAAHTRRIARELRAKGFSPVNAQDAAETRIFSSESGRYGTGLDDAALATDTWQGKAEGDRKLAQMYLARMQYAYGPNEARWGSLPPGANAAGTAGGQALNLYAEHLRGTQGAVLSRSSNVYGMLTTDDPFQYLGGIALAVRQLDGKAPELYISNLRGSGSGKVEGAAQFLAKELATRQFHPGYIQGLMKEGYAGTLQVLDATNNFWGWTAVAREIVRDDQWQEMADVYVRDKHQLGLAKWFEQHNPHALAQTIERMVEAARQGYWQADPATLAELKDRWRDIAARHDVKSDNARFAAFVQSAAAADGAPPAAAAVAGFGLQVPAIAPPAEAAQAVNPPAEAAPPPGAGPPGRGRRMEKVAPPAPQQAIPQDRLVSTLAALMLLAVTALGAAMQARRGGGAPRPLERQDHALYLWERVGVGASAPM